MTKPRICDTEVGHPYNYCTTLVPLGIPTLARILRIAFKQPRQNKKQWTPNTDSGFPIGLALNQCKKGTNPPQIPAK